MEKLNAIIENPKFRENAKEISRRFTDRPMTPQQSVVFWTEYAHRHRGASHLQAAGKHLNFIEFHLIDVYLVLGLILIVAFFVEYKILKFLINTFCCKQHKKKNKKKQN